MDLPERVRERAEALAPRWGDWETGSFDRGRKAGIDAATEALQECLREAGLGKEVDRDGLV